MVHCVQFLTRRNCVCVGYVCVDRSHVPAAPGLAAVHATGRPPGSLQCCSVTPSSHSVCCEAGKCFSQTEC